MNFENLSNPALRVALYDSLRAEGLSDAFAGMVAVGMPDEQLIDSIAESKQRQAGEPAQ